MTNLRANRIQSVGRSSHVLVCLILVGCTTTEELGPQRWIAEDPKDTFSAERIGEPQEVFRWSFRNQAELDAWRLHDVDRETGLTEEGLVVRSSTRDPQLFRDVDIDASAVDIIQVGIAGLEKGIVELFWAVRSEPFQRTKSIQLRPGEGTDRSPDFKVFEFRVGEHPRWAGRVARIRLDPTSRAGERVVIRWLAGATAGISKAEVREVAGKPWKVALGNDLRNALLAVSGDSFEREIAVPADGRLRLAYGAVCVNRSAFARFAPVQLQVLVGPRGRDAERVWEVRLDGDDPARAFAWNEEVIDLSRYGGRQIMVSIRTTAAAGSSDQSPCVMALGNPEVTSGAFERRDPNIILISIDTLRADRLSVYGYRRPTTPHLEDFARDAVVFENAHHTGGGTLPSHLSILTSLYPTTHGVEENATKPLHGRWATLSEALRDAGYATAAFVDAGWVRAKFGFAQGFDVFDEDAGGFARILPKAEGWLRRHGERRFFLFLHTYDVHSQERRPYDCPGDYPLRYTTDRNVEFDGCKDGRCANDLFRWINSEVREGRLRAAEYLAPEEVAYVSSLYDGCINYVDDQLHDFFQRLRELGLYDHSLIVVTSDHGEEFLEHGMFIHDQGGYDEITHIPMLLKLPSSPVRGARVSHLAATVDLMPTVLRVVGVPLPGQVQGVSLLPAIVDDRPVRSEIHFYTVLRTEQWKYFRDRKKLYKLAVDPEEQDNLYARYPKRVRSLGGRLSRLLDADRETYAAFLGGHLESPDVELSEKEMENLRALGYLQ